MSTLVIATSNPHKLTKLTAIFQPYFDEVKSLKDYPELPEIEENGNTFTENARIKAQAVSKELHLTVAATDAGATIPALGDAWDALRTRRFVSEEKTDEDRVKKLLALMKDKTDRRVWFTEACVLCEDGKVILELEVKGPVGRIKDSWDGRMKPGAWLLALWHLPNRNKDFFDLTHAEVEEEENTWASLKEKVDAYFRHA